MVILTDKAVAQIKVLMSKQAYTPPGFRIAVQGGGCSGYTYTMDWSEPKPFDKTFLFDGVTLIVDQASLLYLDGTTVDWVETMASSGFDFQNPLAKKSCGCGKSFAV